MGLGAFAWWQGDVRMAGYVLRGAAVELSSLYHFAFSRTSNEFLSQDGRLYPNVVRTRAWFPKFDLALGCGLLCRSRSAVTHLFRLNVRSEFVPSIAPRVGYDAFLALVANHPASEPLLRALSMRPANKQPKGWNLLEAVPFVRTADRPAWVECARQARKRRRGEPPCRGGNVIGLIRPGLLLVHAARRMHGHHDADEPLTRYERALVEECDALGEPWTLEELSSLYEERIRAGLALDASELERFRQ